MDVQSKKVIMQTLQEIEDLALNIRGGTPEQQAHSQECGHFEPAMVIINACEHLKMNIQNNLIK